MSKRSCRQRSFSGYKGGFWGVSVYFKLLTDPTTLNVVFHKSSKSWPPIMLLHCIISLQFSRVSSSFMIMESLEYISSQFFVQRNIIPSLIEKNISVFKLFQCPVTGSVLLNNVHPYRINFKLIREVWPDEAQYMIVTQSAKFDRYKVLRHSFYFYFYFEHLNFTWSYLIDMKISWSLDHISWSYLLIISLDLISWSTILSLDLRSYLDLLILSSDDDPRYVSLY